MVEEQRVIPRDFGMAGLTLVAERSIVRIVIEMARFTCSLKSYVEDGLDVARRTFNLGVRTQQLVFRVPVVVKGRLGPVVIAVAAIAFLAIVAFMTVIFEVTVNAFRSHLVLEWVFRMAIVTSQQRMFSLEWKVRVSRMIETRVMPIRRVMAVLAFLSTAAVVCIVALVATEAGSWRVLIGFVHVAVETIGFVVLADQWVACRIMIETRVLPLGRRVAFGTSLTQEVLVDIIVFVTVDAFARCFAKLHVRQVAFVTFGLGMCALQHEVGEIVVERLFIQPDDIRFAALMVGVAGCALDASDIRMAAVKTGVAGDIHGHVFVAVHA